jgi:translation initiation factor eIF-2B subunit delta
MPDTFIEDLIAELAQDRESGAAELAKKAAVALAALADEGQATDAASFLREVVETGRKLILAQPSMAPLFNLVNTVLYGLDGISQLTEARRGLKALAEGFADELEGRGETIAVEAAQVLSDGDTVLTHSRSSTVVRALARAKAGGVEFQVVCTESRPLYEGRALADELSRLGVPIVLVVDAAVGQMMQHAHLVVVGADGVSSAGLVNKTGTYLVALAARARGVPFYSLCGTEKLLPEGYPFFAIEDQASGEVWPDHPEGVRVLNRYFEVTPIELLTGLVTEKGLLGPREVARALEDLKMHPLLIEA